MPRFRDLVEFGPTLDAAAERLGISPTAVEKDYWVSEVLRVLARDLGAAFIFKGGTKPVEGLSHSGALLGGYRRPRVARRTRARRDRQADEGHG
jgi:hypothetical protein